MTGRPIVTDTAVDATERAMSAAFRRYTGTRVGDDMWNLNMERTWTLVGRAAVEAAAPVIAAQALRAVGEQISNRVREARDNFRAGAVGIEYINGLEEAGLIVERAIAHHELTAEEASR